MLCRPLLGHSAKEAANAAVSATDVAATDSMGSPVSGSGMVSYDAAGVHSPPTKLSTAYGASPASPSVARDGSTVAHAGSPDAARVATRRDRARVRVEAAAAACMVAVQVARL
jgi:hypothetical protein